MGTTRVAGREGRGVSGALLGLAGVKLAVHLAVAGRYGWHRDELYYAATGRHLALGYPHFPPVTPLLARLPEVVFGGSLAGFRVLPALAALCSPMLLGANAMFQTVTFDQLAWLAVLYLFARLLPTGEPRWWLAVGAAVGAGLETKFTMFTLAPGIALLLLAAGSVGVEALAARRGRPWLLRAVAAAVLLGGLVVAPIALPVLPTARMVDLGLAGAREDWAEMLGWPGAPLVAVGIPVELLAGPAPLRLTPAAQGAGRTAPA